MDKMFTQATVEKGSFNDEERSFVAWASKPVLDRDGEIIASNAWDIENYTKNPVLLWAHNYGMPPVGKALWTKIQGNGMKFKPQFAPTDMGKELYMLYKEGFLNSFSVGFDPKDFEEDGKTVRVLDFWTGEKYDKPVKTFTAAELLEISCVPVPACPDALVERAKEGKIKTKGLVKAIMETAAEPEPEETETIQTSAGEVSGAWEAIEIDEEDPYEKMRDEGLAKANDDIVPVTKELWNTIFDNFALIKAQLPDQPDIDDIDESEDDKIEITDEEFSLLVQEQVKTRQQAEKIKELSHSIKELRAQLRVMSGGIG